MTTETKAYELQRLINICYEAVDKSNVGPIYLRNNDGSIMLDPNRCPISAHVPVQAFLGLLHNLSPKEQFNMNISGVENIDETKKQ